MYLKDLFGRKLQSFLNQPWTHGLRRNFSHTKSNATWNLVASLEDPHNIKNPCAYPFFLSHLLMFIIHIPMPTTRSYCYSRLYFLFVCVFNDIFTIFHAHNCYSVIPAQYLLDVQLDFFSINNTELYYFSSPPSLSPKMNNAVFPHIRTIFLINIFTEIR